MPIYYDRSSTLVIINFPFSLIMIDLFLPFIIIVTFITKMPSVNLL